MKHFELKHVIVSIIHLVVGLAFFSLFAETQAQLTSAGQARQNRTQFMRDAKYGLFFHYLPGTNGRPVAQDMMNGYATSAEWNFSYGHSLWAETVRVFDVNGFVADVQATGAGYVVFTLGQSGGYYCSPSANYQGATSTWMGEFTSSRDLIKDISSKLTPLGIRTIVYIGSDGPAASAPLRRYDQAGNLLGVVSAPSVYLNLYNQPTPAKDAYFRQTFYNMIWQWSYDWGTNVSGWWFDGVIASSGWIDPANASSSYNASTLSSAARVGNPNAVVAFNPGPDDYTILNSGQDYSAGETGYDHTGNSKFWKFPTSAYQGDGYQWHFLSYIGTFWGEGDVRYDTNYLIDYTRYVNSAGAAVTFDVGITASGRLYSGQLAQLQSIKNVIKGTTAPSTQANYAIYKPAKCMNTSGATEVTPSIDWSQATANPPVVRKAYAINGNDGQYSTYALGGDGSYAWTYQVDLVGLNQASQTKTVGTVNVIMLNNNYATQFNLEGASSSSNPLVPGTWTNYRTFYTSNATTFTSGGVSYKKFTITFNPRKSCRFLRVKAITPSIPSQGNQMAISELEVYP
jgi:hypothetical protein